jgi:predicted ABC-type exoprotein transport system permease subunit
MSSRVVFNKKFAKNLVVYLGIAAPYCYLLKAMGVDLISWTGLMVLVMLYVSIDLIRWGLKD